MFVYCCCLFNLRVPLLPVLLELSWVCLWALWGWRSLHLATTKTTILCFTFLLFWCVHFSNSKNTIKGLNLKFKLEIKYDFLKSFSFWKGFWANTLGKKISKIKSVVVTHQYYIPAWLLNKLSFDRLDEQNSNRNKNFDTVNFTFQKNILTLRK